MLLRLVNLMNLMLILSRLISIQGTENNLGDFLKKIINRGLHLRFTNQLLLNLA